MSNYDRILMIKKRKSWLMTALQDAEIRIKFGCNLPEISVIRAVLVRAMPNTVNMGCTMFGLNLRPVATQWCHFFMMPLDSPELELQPQWVLYSGIQTSFDRKNRKTKKLKKLKNAKNAIFCFLHNFSAFAPFAKLRTFTNCSRHSPSNGVQKHWF